MASTHAFVLGLKKNFRGAPLIEQLTDYSIKYKITWGMDTHLIDSRLLDSLVDQKKSRFLLGRELSYGEISCSLGHFEMYEEFLETDLEWGLFLEDDAKLQPEIRHLIERLPRDSQPLVLSLASCLDVRFEPQPFPFLRHGIKIGSIAEFSQCATSPVLAHGYLMNRPAASLAVHLLRSRKIYSPADYPFQFRNSLSFLASTLEYVQVRPSQSYLDSERMGKHRKNPQFQLRKILSRRARVFLDYTYINFIFAKFLSLSLRDYRNERVVFHKEYKKFLKGKSSKYISKFPNEVY